MMQMNNRPAGARATGVDILRFVCAFLVICIHVRFPGKEHLLPALRPAVPLFAMITGYFYADTAARGGKWRQIKKILLLTLGSLLMYIIWDMLVSYFRGAYHWAGVPLLGYSAEWLRYFFTESPRLWQDYFVWNGPPSGPHLWYMIAILYTLVLVALAEGFVSRQKLSFLIPLLLGANLVLGAYAMPLLGKSIRLMYTRNYLFTVLPFFLMGDLLNTQREKLKLSTGLLWLVLLLSLLLSCIEAQLLKRFFDVSEANIYIGTLISAPAALLLAARELPMYESAFGRTIARMGRKYSTGVYIIHYMVFLAMGYAQDWLGHYLPSSACGRSIVSPLSVALVSVALVWLFGQAQRLCGNVLRFGKK